MKFLGAQNVSESMQQIYNNDDFYKQQLLLVLSLQTLSALIKIKTRYSFLSQHENRYDLN